MLFALQRYRLHAVMVFALLVVFGMRFADPPFLASVRLTQFDFLQRILPRQLGNSHVVIIDIDDASLATHGQWPWPRDLLAQLLDQVNAAQPTAVGLEILFFEPDRLSPEQLAQNMPDLPSDIRIRLSGFPTHDEILAKSLSGGRIVLADAPVKEGAEPNKVQTGTLIGITGGGDAADFLLYHSGLRHNARLLESASDGHGAAIFYPDIDGVVRWVPFAVNIGGQIVPSFPVELLRVATRTDLLMLDVQPAFGVTEGRIGGLSVPTDASGNMWLRYSPIDRGSYISAKDLLEGTGDLTRLRGKIVLIGATASGVGPMFATPLGTQMPGLELFAQAIEAMAGQTILLRNGVILFVELIAVGAIFLLFSGRSGRRASVHAMILLACCTALGLACWLGFEFSGVLFDASFGIFAAGVFFVVRLMHDLYREAQNRAAAERALRQALAHAEAANRAKSNFLANMSHELRTPLTAILGFSSLIRDQELGAVGNDKYVEYAGDIHSSGSHLLAIISDILEMSKIETGHAALHETTVDVYKIATDAVGMLRPRIERKQLTMTTDLAPGLPALRGDAPMIKQMLVNLLTNAVTFTDEKGTVSLQALLRADGGIDIEVSDTGIGVSESDISKILEPFYTTEHPLVRNYQGAGLGLPIAKSLLELHGGRLTLTSALNVGTSVTLSFPAERSLARLAVNDGQTMDRAAGDPAGPRAVPSAP